MTKQQNNSLACNLPESNADLKQVMPGRGLTAVKACQVEMAATSSCGGLIPQRIGQSINATAS